MRYVFFTLLQQLKFSVLWVTFRWAKLRQHHERKTAIPTFDRGRAPPTYLLSWQTRDLVPSSLGMKFWPNSVGCCGLTHYEASFLEIPMPEFQALRRIMISPNLYAHVVARTFGGNRIRNDTCQSESWGIPAFFEDDHWTVWGGVAFSFTGERSVLFWTFQWTHKTPSW